MSNKVVCGWGLFVRLPDPSPSAIGLLRLLVAASIAVPLMLFVIVAWLGYRTMLRDTGQDLLRSSEVAREFVAKIFDGQAQVADRIGDVVRGRPDAEIERDERTLHDEFAAITARVPSLQSVILINRDGRALVSGGVYPIAAAPNLADRDFFKAIMAGYPGAYVSDLQLRMVSRQLFFGLARPWTGEDGSIRGVIDVAVSPSYIRDFFSVVIGEGRVGAEGTFMSLVRDDGTILARFPDVPVTAKSRPVRFIEAIAKDRQQGLFRSRSITDPGSPARLYAYRKVQNYPVYVLAGRNLSAVQAEWWDTLAGHLAFGLPATAALCVITWSALSRAKREQEALSLARLEIRRRQDAEDALLRAQRLEAVGQLTGGVAHDFNNLLTVIMGSAELLARRSDDPGRVRQIAGQIAMAAKRGGEVTQQLLAFSRRQFVNPEVVDLNARLRDFKQLLDRAAQESVEVTLELDHSLHQVRLDPGHFEAAILNLVGNARDAMPKGGSITVTTSNTVLGPLAGELPPGDYVRVAVTDTGTGMDEATAAKAFEPFFTTKDIGKGTGLGLSQVYGFAKQAGGDARIRTAPGHGTTVELILPRATQSAPAGSAETASAAHPAADGEVILVVEDEPGVRRMVVETLRDIGYVAVAAGSAQAALDILRNGSRVDLLLSDIMMPGGMDGLQLADEARRIRPELKILLTSGYSAGFSQAQMPGVPLLSKPYDRAQLERRLDSLLHGAADAG